MAIDYPDWGGVSGLGTAIAAMTAAVNALTAGYGATALGTLGKAQLDLKVNTSSVIIPAQGAGKVVSIIAVTFYWSASLGEQHRGEVTPRLYDTSSVLFLSLASLSPESPTVALAYPPGTVKGTANSSVTFDTVTFYGASSQDNVGALIVYSVA